MWADCKYAMKENRVISLRFSAEVASLGLLSLQNMHAKREADWVLVLARVLSYQEVTGKKGKRTD